MEYVYHFFATNFQFIQSWDAPVKAKSSGGSHKDKAHEIDMEAIETITFIEAVKAILAIEVIVPIVDFIQHLSHENICSSSRSQRLRRDFRFDALQREFSILSEIIAELTPLNSNRNTFSLFS